LSADIRELVRIYVDQALIGRGVGAVLMQASLDEARRMGCDAMWLGVWERNERAQAFYRRWGFEVAGTQPFQLGADPQTDLVMGREI
jgi:ribosomal protein S18 acetylase RimI-like enzyme